MARKRSSVNEMNFEKCTQIEGRDPSEDSESAGRVGEGMGSRTEAQLFPMGYC